MDVLTYNGVEYPNFYVLSRWIPSIEDVAEIGIWALVITIARLYTQRFFMQIAEKQNIQEKTKYSEANWKVCFYTLAYGLDLLMVWRCDWFPKTINCWLNYPNIVMEPETRAFYLFQLGFYLHSLYAHFRYEVKRSDYWPLLIHHLVTIWLIYFSYVVGLSRIGVLVLFCHDANDVTFEVGKTFVYRKNNFMINVTYVIILFTWIATRLTLFPLVVIWSAFIESATIIPIEVFPFYWGFNLSLMFLVCLHVYWFGLMLRMGYRVATGKEKDIVDSREVDPKGKKQK